MESWNDELDESGIPPDTVGCNPSKLLNFLASKMKSWSESRNDELDESGIPPDTVGCNPSKLLNFLTSKMESWNESRNDELDESGKESIHSILLYYLMNQSI